MPGLTILPKYPVEWFQFMRAPGPYIEKATTPDQPNVFEPWAAFALGLSINIAFASYEAHKWHDAIDQGTDQLNLILGAALNFGIVHAICRFLGGRGSTKNMGAAFEYLYGFLIPASAASMTVLMAIVGLFPGMSCRLRLDTFNCTYLPTSMSLIVLSSVQAVVVAIPIYMLVIFNVAVARIQKLGHWKVLFAQVIGLGILFLIGSPLYGFSHWIATRFGDLIGRHGG